MGDLLVKKNNYKELDNLNPVACSYGLKDSIILLIHENDKCIFFNIYDSINKYNFDLVIKYLIKNKNVIDVDIFVNDDIDSMKLCFIKFLINRIGCNYRINNLYKFDNIESLGYNYNLNEYYSVNIIDNVLTFRKKKVSF